MVRRVAFWVLVGALLWTPAAQADWRVTDDGAALLENEGHSSLALRCDNNASTGGRPGWRIDVETLDLRRHGSRFEMVFRFPGRAPLRIMGDNRQGRVTLDSLTQATQGDLLALVRQLKAARRVTVTLIDDASGAALDPLTFSLRGSGRAIGQVARACQMN